MQKTSWLHTSGRLTLHVTIWNRGSTFHSVKPYIKDLLNKIILLAYVKKHPQRSNTIEVSNIPESKMATGQLVCVPMCFIFFNIIKCYGARSAPRCIYKEYWRMHCLSIRPSQRWLQWSKKMAKIKNAGNEHTQFPKVFR